MEDEEEKEVEQLVTASAGSREWLVMDGRWRLRLSGQLTG